MTTLARLGDRLGARIDDWLSRLRESAIDGPLDRLEDLTLTVALLGLAAWVLYLVFKKKV